MASPDAATAIQQLAEPSSRSKKYDPKKPHITDLPITRSNWYKHVNWLNVTLIIFIPLAGVIGSYWTPLRWETAVWTVAYYFMTGLGITAGSQLLTHSPGYHRLWAHSSYSATLPLKIFLAAVGAGAVEGSIRWWSRDHRAHHRYTDTDKDPYSVRKGLLYSHFGWMVMKQNPKRIGRTDISDLNDDAVVVWQHRNYIKCVLFMGLIFPCLVTGFGWGDWLGGFIYAGILRIFFVQQATFCVNSLAHWLGDQPFDDRNSPRDHVITALVTLGEGYHNFHHEFPSDYRNAIQWYQYDPTKWSIWVWKQLGLAYDLKQFKQNEIEKGRLQQLQKKLDQKRQTLDWGIPLEQLPIIDWDTYQAEAKNGRALVSVAGVIHDVTDFIKDHPGGKALITSAIGKDATAMFNGGVYDHSNAAHNLLSTMRVGVLRGGCEVEIWKRAQYENKDVSYVSDSAGHKIVRAGNQVTRVRAPVASADAA
ncbi:putative acyl-CoA desaturase [Xylogone sp. PMI_703]|nr:putative acyl-CoA desaturase [Xylogone sp. PMI_703]